MSNLYRILNEEERLNVKYNSRRDKSERKKNVERYYEHFLLICDLSQKCNIKISSALRIANQIYFEIGNIQQLERNGQEEIPLSLFYVINENKTHIPLLYLIDFVYKYTNVINKTNLLVDELGAESIYIFEFIWEHVRRKNFPDAFSRLESCFAFQSQSDALDFADQWRDGNNNMCEVELRGAFAQEYDMQWFTLVSFDFTMHEAEEYACKYWSGHKTENPKIEVLVNGEYELKEL